MSATATRTTLTEQQLDQIVALRNAARAAHGTVTVALDERDGEVGVEIEGRGIDWTGYWLDDCGDWRDEHGRHVRWTALRHDSEPVGIYWSARS